MRNIAKHQGIAAMAVSRSKPADRTVDAWIRRELTAQYRAILDEPVPADLIRLAGLVADPARRTG